MATAAAFMNSLRAPISHSSRCADMHMPMHLFSAPRPCSSSRATTVSSCCLQHASAAAARASIACAAAAASHQQGGVQQTQETLPELPNAAYGQVVSAEANFVRVNISHLETSSSSNSSSSSSNGSSGPQHSPQPPPVPPVKQLLCTVRALLKKMGQRVLVGDSVRVQPIDWTSGRGVVESIQPRSSELADPAVANVDHVLLLFGLTQPPFEPAQVSRFLVSLGAAGLPVTLALNKADLLPASEVEARLEQVSHWGYAAVAVSCETGQGLDAVAQQLAGKVSVVAGPSGAGKSSLINALRLGRHKPDAPAALTAAAAGSSSSSNSSSGGFDAAQLREGAHGVRWQYGQQQGQQQQEGGELSQQTSSSSSDCSSSNSSCHDSGNEDDMHPSSSSSTSSFLAVGDVSRIGRGRHTTRTVTLIELPFGGYMADTPGFNQPTLDRVSSAELAGLFPEFVAAQEAGGGCRFADCMHLAEPGCAVTAAELERHEHYVKFLAEIKTREDFDVRVMQLEKQRREGAVKAKTGLGGATRYEARLNSKKHRTTSRRRMKQSMWGDVGDDDDDAQQEEERE